MSRYENGASFNVGAETLAANGRRGDVLLTSSFITGDHTQPYPFPRGDAYLGRLAPLLAEPGEIVIITTALPGEIKFKRKIGVIEHGVDVIEVTPQIQNEERPGYPATDPLALLDGQIQVFPTLPNGEEDTERDMYHVGIFSNPAIRQQVHNLGLQDLDRPDSSTTNHKAEFRAAAERYGIRVLPGHNISEDDDIEATVAQYGDSSHGIWLKFPTGSGGDLVTPIRDVTAENLRNGIADMRTTVLAAFEQGDFKTKALDFWPEDSLAPLGFPLVAESDVRNGGLKIITNGSNHFITNKSGEVEMLNTFEQLVSDDGEYLGGRPYHPDKEVLDMIIDQTQRVGQYNIEENGYYGLQGMDYFVVEDAQGRRGVYVVELNTRPIINTFPDRVARRLGAKEWINTNIYGGTPITDIKDFIELVGEDLALGRRDEDGVLTAQVIPMAFRTEFSRTEQHGEVVYPSGAFKALVVGQNQEQCEEVRRELEEKGLSFTPPK